MLLYHCRLSDTLQYCTVNYDPKRAATVLYIHFQDGSYSTYSTYANDQPRTSEDPRPAFLCFIHSI